MQFRPLPFAQPGQDQQSAPWPPTMPAQPPQSTPDLAPQQAFPPYSWSEQYQQQYSVTGSPHMSTPTTPLPLSAPNTPLPLEQPAYPDWDEQPPALPQRWSPQRPPKKKRGSLVVGALLALVVLIGIIVAGIAQGYYSASSSPSGGQSSPATTHRPTSGPTVQSTVVTPVLTAAELEAAYKASTTTTTVATLDKAGKADSGENVHFIATIFNLVKDESGTTAGANVTDPGTSGAVQVLFPSRINLSLLKVGDILEVWGLVHGTVTGQNALGATSQEVVLQAIYLTDQTTGYQIQY